MRESNTPKLDEVIRNLPDMPQRQDGSQDQLRDLWHVANKLGLYDAADAIKSMAGLT